VPSEPSALWALLGLVIDAPGLTGAVNVLSLFACCCAGAAGADATTGSDADAAVADVAGTGFGVRAATGAAAGLDEAGGWITAAGR
jgi:hypothetical protein